MSDRPIRTKVTFGFGQHVTGSAAQRIARDKPLQISLYPAASKVNVVGFFFFPSFPTAKADKYLHSLQISIKPLPWLVVFSELSSQQLSSLPG